MTAIVSEVRLADCVELLAGFAFKSDRFEGASGGGVPLVKGENVGQGRILWDIARYWPANEAPGLDKFRLQAGDVVLAMDRPWVPAGLKWAVIREQDPAALLVQRCARLRTRTSQLRQDFLRYVIGGPGFEDYIRPITTGVNVPHISGAQILAYSFWLPPVEEQRRIAGILSAYDDLIENCERRIRVLDEMARSLYREWFVDFRFPGARGSGMPKAWKSVTAASLVREFRRGVPKGTMRACLPYVGLEHLPRRSLALNDWIETAELGSNKLRFEPGEVLFGKIRPYFHKVAVAPFVGVCSADTFVISSIRPEHRAFVTCLVSSDAFVAHASATANGAKMPRANWEVLMEFPVAVPPDEIVAKFASIVAPCIEQQMQLVRQAKNLRATRDLLLPRLLSGQLSVDDAA